MFFYSFSFIFGLFSLRSPQFLTPLPGINQPFRPTIRHRPSARLTWMAAPIFRPSAIHPHFFRSHGTSGPQPPSIPSSPNRPKSAAFWASTKQKSGLSSRPVTFSHLKTLQTSFECNMNVNLLSHFVLPFCPLLFLPFHYLTHYLSFNSIHRPHRSIFPRFVLPPLLNSLFFFLQYSQKRKSIQLLRTDFTRPNQLSKSLDFHGVKRPRLISQWTSVLVE